MCTSAAVREVYTAARLAENSHSSSCPLYDTRHHHPTGTFPVVDECQWNTSASEADPEQGCLEQDSLMQHWYDEHRRMICACTLVDSRTQMYLPRSLTQPHSADRRHSNRVLQSLGWWKILSVDCMQCSRPEYNHIKYSPFKHHKVRQV